MHLLTKRHSLTYNHSHKNEFGMMQITIQIRTLWSSNHGNTPDNTHKS